MQRRRSRTTRTAHAARAWGQSVSGVEPLEGRTLLSDGTAVMVKDINGVTPPSNPSHFVRLNGVTLFRADDGVHGNEWFRTDGTAGGTALLRDVNPGGDGSLPRGGSPEQVVAGNLLFFTAADAAGGLELWKTDGTTAGTARVKDLTPGTIGSFPKYLTAVGDAVYFIATENFSKKLFRSDGTAAGTRAVVADWPAGAPPVPLAALGGKLVYASGYRNANEFGAGLELWFTDGTPAGTSLLKEIHPLGSSRPGVLSDGAEPEREVAVAGGRVFFAATDPAYGRELWATDGTPAGTVRLTDLAPGAAGSHPRQFTPVGDWLYFTAGPGTFDEGRRLYRLRLGAGAPAPVEEITRLNYPGTDYQVLGAAGGRFFMVGPVQGVYGLFGHDPAAPAGAGLTLLRRYGTPSEAFSPAMPMRDGRFIADLEGRAFLFGTVPTGTGARPTTIDLLRTDGTPQGTTVVRTLPATHLNAAPDDATGWEVLNSGGTLYFTGNDAVAGAEPWTSDGVPQDTARLVDLNAASFGSAPSAVTWLNGRGLFAADDGVHGRELWTTDGTPARTVLLKEFTPGPDGGVFQGHSGEILRPFDAVLDGRSYFAARNAEGSVELWSTDGTAEGTVLVKDINDGLWSSFPRGFTPYRGRLYFIADRQAGGSELWVTDGTAAGTVRFSGQNYAGSPVVAGENLYFVAYDDRGWAWWKTDGTAEGTARVADLDPRGGGAVALGGILYYLAPPPAGGTMALWRSDGTPGGTAVVKTLPANPSDLMVAGGKLFFVAGRPNNIGSTVWVSDGTADGTVPLPQIAPNTANVSGPTGLTLVGNSVYFFQPTPNAGTQLWRTDGTAAGTAVVKTLLRHWTSGGSTVLGYPLGVADGVFYFRANASEEPDHLDPGSELWRSDGTAAGTVMVQDVRTGPEGSFPADFSFAGGRIFFTADDGTRGRELWTLPPRPAARVVGRWVFYNNSAHDGNDGAANPADDRAVAAGKAALLPAQTPSFANVTSFGRGINGVMVDVAGLPQDKTPTADDFEFGAAGSPTSVTVRRGAGVDGSDRVTLVWRDYNPQDASPLPQAVGNGWLTVTVRANANTGLSSPDAFSFGNLIGETGDGGGASGWRVSALDLANVKRAINADAGVASTTDFDRNGRTNALDLAVVRRALNQGLPLPAPKTSQALTVRRVADDLLV